MNKWRFFLTFYSLKNPEKVSQVQIKNIKQHSIDHK